MIQFRECTLSDKALLDSYLARVEKPSCDHTFTNIYAWQPTYHTLWAEVEGALVLRFQLSELQVGYIVVGAEDYARTLDALWSYLGSREEDMRLMALSEQDMEGFAAWAQRMGLCCALCNNADYRDYIYLVEDLATLSGRKYQPKRNHINKFESRYNYEFRELEKQYFQQCLCLECRWQLRKAVMENPQLAKEHDCKDTEEKVAIRRAFEQYDELGLYGGVLLVEGRVVAFTYGTPLSQESFCTHIEKADVEFEGAFAMINRCFANALLQRGYRYVNREEDMGLAGLRRAKESYYPVELRAKGVARIIDSRLGQCRELWLDVFRDEPSDVECFLAEYCKDENMLTHIEQGRVVSMLYIADIETDYGPTAYLYAIATHADSRGRGYASHLIEQAIALARARGYAAVMLIPSDETLIDYYSRFGFAQPAYSLDFSEGYDYGTGDKRKDIAMVLTL